MKVYMYMVHTYINTSYVINSSFPCVLEYRVRGYVLQQSVYVVIFVERVYHIMRTVKYTHRASTTCAREQAVSESIHVHKHTQPNSHSDPTHAHEFTRSPVYIHTHKHT